MENLPKGENRTREDMKENTNDLNQFQKMEVDQEIEKKGIEEEVGEIIKLDDDDL